MSTRSLIGVINPDGSIQGIYCHFDGMIVGILLKKYYSEESLVRRLLSKGDIESLGPDVRSTVFFHTPINKEDTFEEFRFFKSKEEAFKDFMFDYKYLWDNDHWICRKR